MLRHPRDRAAALHLTPANANGLEGVWAGEGVQVVEHGEGVLGDNEDGGERRLLA